MQPSGGTWAADVRRICLRRMVLLDEAARDPIATSAREAEAPTISAYGLTNYRRGM